MDARIGAWEPARQRHAAADAAVPRLKPEAQAWQPPPHQQGHHNERESDVAAAGHRIAGRIAAAEHHAAELEWPPMEGSDGGSGGYYQREERRAGMAGGLLVVEPSAGGAGGDGGLYSGYGEAHAGADGYGAHTENTGYGEDMHQQHHGYGQPVQQQEHHEHHQSQQQYGGHEEEWQYGEYAGEYGGGGGGFVPSFERAGPVSLSLESPVDASPSSGIGSTASSSLDSPAVMFSPHGTMYSMASDGSTSSTTAEYAPSPMARSSAEIQQPPELHGTRPHEVLFPSAASTAPAPAPMRHQNLSVEIGSGLGSTELPPQPVDYIGVVDFECTCDRIRAHPKGNPLPNMSLQTSPELYRPHITRRLSVVLLTFLV